MPGPIDAFRSLPPASQIAWALIVTLVALLVLRPREVFGGAEPLVFGWMPTWLFRTFAILLVLVVLYGYLFVRTTRLPPETVARLEED